MWPFKKKPVVDFKDLVETFDPAPCGYQYEHYFWPEIEGMPCPHCARISAEDSKKEASEQQAELIARKVAKMLMLSKSGPF